MVLHSERWTLTDDFHQPQHSDPPPRLVCLGTPLATCALPTGVFYLLTYFRSNFGRFPSLDARMQKRKTSLAGAATLFQQRNYYYYVK